jgi:threonine dehydrogenase-like Zn-dependent dehydrogenase
MKALNLIAYNRLEFSEVPEPEIGEEDVLVRVRATGICGSDVHGLDGSSGRRVPPIVMGHEAAGIIERVGPAVAGWQAGDRVTFDSTIYCGSCAYCREGLFNLCDRRRVFGVSCSDYRQAWTFAEYVAVPQRILYRLPQAVSFVQGALVEPLAIAAHAITQTRVGPNTEAVVIGSGVIGLLMIQLLHAQGCAKIIAVDVDSFRLDKAREMGAHETLRSDRDDVVSEVRRLTSRQGADVSFEAVGVPATVGLATEVLRKAGAAVLIGNLAPTVELALQTIVTRQLTITGSAASCGEYRSCLDMLAARRINVDSIISAVRPLSEGATWFGRLSSGQEPLVKVILEP